ncbi:MAG: 2-oxoacid:ferredoxin oxidoreductase subunit beta [Chloroflexi bacterium]|jgi:2-oxoglutarate ferredoxin oxidoreductase subunit beta|nr:MAG: 2-oxoacid:ferredoxin oxidoreductase subunit beta [Chloroflexota bacterium]RLT33286.1 MAG: 2-oxoacid:ferredoxin oxidoreductase subunit beta [Chloroflexota bacterium]
MTATTTRPTNRIGLTTQDYQGGTSTLCAGCGHNSITSQIIAACYDLSLDPATVLKMSGIGCSSKTPAYFLGKSFGFNTLHGRMPSVTTGAMIANRTMTAIGVSGDGDTGSIGFGQFKHMMRRNVPMVYIVENNGVYGLTKGQHSATADIGQHLKYAGTNVLPPIDICAEAIAADCGFVARSFSGDAKQVRELIKAAMSYEGTAVIDIISPCVTFNNEDDSSKSYAYGKDKEERIQDIQFIQSYEEVVVDYEPGSEQIVKLHDGPTIKLRKLNRDYDATDRWAAIKLLEECRQSNIFVTGLIHINESRPTLQQTMSLIDEPLAYQTEAQLRPSRAAFAAVMAEF